MSAALWGSGIGALSGALIGGYQANREGRNMIGGILLGAGVGAAAGRYAGAGAAWMGSSRMNNFTGFARGVRSQARKDFRSTRKWFDGAFGSKTPASNKKSTTLSGNEAVNPIATPAPQIPPASTINLESQRRARINERLAEKGVKNKNTIEDVIKSEKAFDDTDFSFLGQMEKQGRVRQSRASVKRILRKKAKAARSMKRQEEMSASKAMNNFLYSRFYDF